MEGVTPPFSEQEKRILLAEAIKQSSIPAERLLAFLNDGNVQPAWNHMILPYGRTLQSCIDAYEALRNGLAGRHSPYPILALPSTSNKRKSAPESLEHILTAPSPKRRQSGVETLSSARDIRPKPPSSNGSPLPLTSLVGPPAPQPKKRGRPSKADVELRQQEAIARGEVLPPSKILTPKAPKQVVGQQSSTAGFTVIAPMTTAGPPTDPSAAGQYQGETIMGDSGKKKRAPRQSKGLKNPGEATFAAVNPQPSQTPQVKEPDLESAQLPAPRLPSEPSQPVPPKEEEEKAPAQPVKTETAPEVEEPAEAPPPTKT
ncbi:uncharacterized protein BP5553_03667 [Venustampulla echinocandica]|uniref:Uncharacterized protein n=1 Tax=Venustampulla echinocandica TaxID=2656787 RepID=A0A370TUW4_9HELO|nr:uncharacterized protein BP5553_03667 [Venustampulla echinocandica]RDL39327.1 hypothetical protein BP5553_03667 [Venustampulla echinocandica]